MPILDLPLCGAPAVPPSWFRPLKHVLLSLALAIHLPLQATSCPPVAQPPSAERLAELQTQAQDRGLLWRLKRDGRTSYLFGTVHIGREVWSQPGPLLRQALKDSRVLALELDLQDPATQAVLLSPPSTKPMALPPDEQARLRAQAKAACLPPELLAPLHPLLQLGTYAGLAGRRDGLDPSWGQESMLGAWARTHALRIVALERPEDQLTALIPEDPKEARRQLREGLDQLESGQLRPMLRRLTDIWARGDLQALADYPRWCQCVRTEADRAQLRRLNDERNPALAQGIAALHAQGEPVLAAVGALHMTGPQALPVLLRGLGFEVEALWPARYDGRRNTPPTQPVPQPLKERP